jgi:hypothetical protein
MDLEFHLSPAFVHNPNLSVLPLAWDPSEDIVYLFLPKVDFIRRAYSMSHSVLYTSSR